MIYQWKTGSQFKTPAYVAARVMSELEAKGRLTAEQLVEVSRPEDAPLHSEFEWNDAVAAEEWRKQVGRVMIASVTVIHEETEQKEPVRMFFHIEPKQPNYEAVDVIIRNEDKTEKLLKQAMRELEAFRRKYACLTQFRDLFAAADKLLEKCS